MAIVLRTLRHHHRYLTFLLSSTIVLFCFHFQNSVVIFTYNSYFRYVSEPAPCACATCALDRGRADGFSARYEPTVHLLLNSSNSELRADVFGWWKGLQNVTSVANYTSVVKNLFPLFLDKEHYSDAGPDRCRTCAVVGNSGNLLRSHYGPLIDSNDFVVRINKGPTEGFEKDVGSRTTHRIMYPESSVDMDNSTHLVFSPFKILDIEWLISAFTTKNITKTYMDVPSTIQANKDKVNVFGFGATKAGQWHHYFDETLTLYVNESHAGDFEYQTILRLEQEKRIVMFKGWT